MKILNFFFLLFIFQSAVGQTVNRQELLEKLNITDNSIFIINGKVFNVGDTLSLDKKLSNIDTKKIIQITKLTDESKIELRTTNDVVIITYATQKELKINKQQLKKAKKILKDNKEQTIFLFIDNQKISNDEIFEKISVLKAEEILEILIKKKTKNIIVPKDIDDNEFVKIWLK